MRTTMLLTLLALTGCSAVLDTRGDCRVLITRMEKSPPEELWSVSEVFRANGCTDRRNIQRPQHVQFRPAQEVNP